VLGENRRNSRAAKEKEIGELDTKCAKTSAKRDLTCYIDRTTQSNSDRIMKEGERKCELKGKWGGGEGRPTIYRKKQEFS